MSRGARFRRRKRILHAISAWCLLVASPLLGGTAFGIDTPSDTANATTAFAEDPLACAIPTFDDRCEDFVSVFDNEGAGGWNFLSDMEISPSGHRVYLTGQSIGNLFDTVVAVYDSTTGEALTTIRWDGGNSNENPFASELSPDGETLYVVGGVNGRRSEVVHGVKYGYPDFGTVAFDVASGTEEWASFYEAPGLGVGAARASALSSDGKRLYVTGESPSPGSGLGNEAKDFVTIAYRAEAAQHPERIGEEIWTARYDGSRFDFVTGAALSRDDSRLFVTGNAGNDGMTIAYDAASGDRLWAKRLAAGGYTFNEKVVVSPDGERIFVAGMREEVSPGDGSSLASVVAYDADTGNELWTDVTPAQIDYNDAVRTGSWSRALSVSEDGGAVFHAGTASISSAARENNLFTVALNAETGARLWDEVHLAPVSNEHAWAVTPDPSGESVLVSGYTSYPGQTCDALTIAYAADDGEQLWAARYPWLQQPVRPCNQGRKIAAIETGGRILVAGQISNLTNSENPFNFGLLGYDL